MRLELPSAIAVFLLLGWSAALSAQRNPYSAPVVQKVEQALAAQGYDPGRIDGTWTAQTKEAVQRAQSDREFEPTGQLDQRTIAAIGIRDTDNPFMGESGASAGAGKERSTR
jgi:peptidoglycan hydrolase-like protein with peptidoglycan-binding domain